MTTKEIAEMLRLLMCIAMRIEEQTKVHKEIERRLELIEGEIAAK